MVARRSLFNTRTAYSDKASCWPYHKATSPAQRRAVIGAYHNRMLAGGFGLYNPLWPWELDAATNADLGRYKANWAPTMLAWFDGQTFRLPPQMEMELAAYSPRPLLLQHISRSIYSNAGSLVANNHGRKSPAWAPTIAKFYAAAQVYFAQFDIPLYIHIDEPPIDFSGRPGAYHALPLAQQTAPTQLIHTLTQIVRDHSAIKIGPTLTSCWHLDWWRQLQTPFNWVLFCDDDGARARKAGWAPRFKNDPAELWFYYTRPPSSYSQARTRLTTAGARGFLMWACIYLSNSAYRLFHPPDNPPGFTTSTAPNEAFSGFQTLL